MSEIRITQPVVKIFGALAFVVVAVWLFFTSPSNPADEVPATKPLVVASMAVTNMSGTVPPSVIPIREPARVQKPPVDPFDPDPTPIPSPTPRPTPVPTIPDGTIGCQFPPIYDKWWLRPTDQYAYLAGLVEDEYYRTNIMFNWEGQFQHEIEAVSSTGMVLGSLSFDTYLLEHCTPDNITYRDGVCSGMFQLNRFISHIDPNYTGVYSIRVKPISGAGRIFFYATMIDNRSGDCTTFTQFRRTKGNNMWAESGLYYQGSFDAETEDI